MMLPEDTADAQLAEFAKAVEIGLQANPKYISSRYFYDENGGELFRKIMGLDEYYLTRTEFEILNTYKQDIFRTLNSQDEAKIEIIELGAGDGYKTKLLLNHFIHNDAEITYTPIDINKKALSGLCTELSFEFPEVKLQPLHSDYFAALKSIASHSGSGRLILFLGSNIGNFTNAEAIDFLSKIRANLSEKDVLLIGFDLQKDPEIILAAYNDASGVTANFNFNLLTRINNELGGHFKLKNFTHSPVYDPENGEARSYLKSRIRHTVPIDALNLEIAFEKDETIHTEISRKYSLPQIKDLAKQSGFKVLNNLTDKRNYFCVSLWQAGKSKK